MGKVLPEDQTYGELVGGSPVYTTNTVSSVYNGLGFRTQLSYPAGARTITFAPDELNRRDTLTDSYFSSPNNATKYDYLGPSRDLNRLYPNTTKLTMVSRSSD